MVRSRRVGFRLVHVCGIALLALTPGALAQELGSLEWFQSQWRAAEDLTIPDNSYFEYSIELRVAGDAEDLARLAGIVEGKPDHPLRAHYQELKRQIEHGPKVERYRLWYGDANHWRLSADFDFDVPAAYLYLDTAVRDEDNAWQLSARTLRMLDPRHPPEGRDPALLIRVLPLYYVQWMAMGFGAGPLGIEPIDSSVSDGQWIAHTRSRSGDRLYQLTGVMDAQQGIIRLREREVLESRDEPKWIGGRRLYTDWAYLESIGRWAARRVEWVDSDGLAYQSVVLHEVRSLRPGELDALLAPPAPDGTDPIRGQSTFASIVDQRPGQGRSQDSPAGASPPTPTPPTASPGSRTSTPAWLVPAGWTLAAIIAVALMLLWLKRRTAP